MESFLYNPGDKVSLVWCEKVPGSGGEIISRVRYYQENFYLVHCDFPDCEMEHTIPESSLEKIDGPESHSEKEVPKAMIKILEGGEKLFYVEHGKGKKFDKATAKKWI